MLLDLRVALRLLAKNPTFTVVVCLTLAIGIGGTTTMFTVVDAALLRPLPFPEPERLVWGWGKFPQGDRASISPPDFMDYRGEARKLRVAAMTSFTRDTALSGEAEPESVGSTLASAGFFEVLGIRPALGRGFVPADEQEEQPLVAVISHALWQRRVGGDSGALGRPIVLDGRPFTLVGVMPAGFRFPTGTEVWTSLPLVGPEAQIRRFHYLRLVGRLDGGATLAGAQAELDTIAARLAAEHPDSNQGWSVRLLLLRDQMVGPVRAAVLVLFGAMACVLLIACANVASLLLAKSASRRREMSIRAALGAGRRRLVRQLLVESVSLSLIGGAAGVLVAYWGVEGLRLLAPAGTLGMEQAAVDGRVLTFALVLSLATGVLFGLAPAREASRVDLCGALGERLAGAPRRRTRAAFVVAETGLAVMLLVGAGLLLRSMAELLRVDTGFDVESVLSATLRLPDARYRTEDQVRSFTSRLVEQAGALPGVRQVAVTSRLPMAPQGGDTYFTVEGEPEPPQGKPNADIRAVGPGYFQTMGIRVLGGRDIASRDAPGAPFVVIVNEPFARTYLSGNPLGRRLRIDMGRTLDAEVVGVVAGVRQYSLGFEPNPAMYMAMDQVPNSLVNLVVRGGTEISPTASAMRTLVRGLDRELPVEVVALEERVARSTADTRLRVGLVGGIASSAILLAAVGVYGLMAGFVADRRREIGLRMALGARVEDVMRLIFTEGARLAGAGLLLGIAAALALGRALSSLLFRIRPWDPLTFVGVATLVALVAAVACSMPARQAARIDPSRALRED